MGKEESRSRRNAIESIVAAGLLPEITALRRLPSQELYACIQAMSYGVFLETAYWKSVRDAVAFLHCGCCARCQCKVGWQVHHVTYEHHGLEHLHLEDLELLCGECHQQEHGLITGTAAVVEKVLNELLEVLEYA